MLLEKKWLSPLLLLSLFLMACHGSDKDAVDSVDYKYDVELVDHILVVNPSPKPLTKAAVDILLPNAMTPDQKVEVLSSKAIDLFKDRLGNYSATLNVGPLAARESVRVELPYKLWLQPKVTGKSYPSYPFSGVCSEPWISSKSYSNCGSSIAMDELTASYESEWERVKQGLIDAFLGASGAVSDGDPVKYAVENLRTVFVANFIALHGHSVSLFRGWRCESENISACIKSEIIFWYEISGVIKNGTGPLDVVLQIFDSMSLAEQAIHKRRVTGIGVSAVLEN